MQMYSWRIVACSEGIILSIQQTVAGTASFASLYAWAHENASIASADTSCENEGILLAFLNYIFMRDKNDRTSDSVQWYLMLGTILIIVTYIEGDDSGSVKGDGSGHNIQKI